MQPIKSDAELLEGCVVTLGLCSWYTDTTITCQGYIGTDGNAKKLTSLPQGHAPPRSALKHQPVRRLRKLATNTKLVALLMEQDALRPSIASTQSNKIVAKVLQDAGGA